MTEGAAIQPLLPGQPLGIDDKPACRGSGVGSMKSHMFRSGAMAFFTIDAIDDLIFIIEIAGFCIAVPHRLCIGAMTFHTIGLDLPVEAGLIIGETRTITPTI